MQLTAIFMKIVNILIKGQERCFPKVSVTRLSGTLCVTTAPASDSVRDINHMLNSTTSAEPVMVWSNTTVVEYKFRWNVKQRCCWSKTGFTTVPNMDFASTGLLLTSGDTAPWGGMLLGRPTGWWWKEITTLWIITWSSTNSRREATTMDREVNATSACFGKKYV